MEAILNIYLKCNTSPAPREYKPEKSFLSAFLSWYNKEQ